MGEGKQEPEKPVFAKPEKLRIAILCSKGI